METAAFVKQIDKLPGYRGQVVHVERLKTYLVKQPTVQRIATDAALGIDVAGCVGSNRKCRVLSAVERSLRNLWLNHRAARHPQPAMVY